MMMVMMMIVKTVRMEIEIEIEAKNFKVNRRCERQIANETERDKS